jgi:pyrroline-5-carboxylate reductase
MNYPTLAFIGGGNMARSLISGLLQDGWAAEKICVADPDNVQLDSVRALHSAIVTSTDNQRVAEMAEVIVLAVKPQILHTVAASLQATVQQHKPLIVSIAAGIRAADINRWLGGNLAIVRCMPNTPALVRSGATGLFANNAVGETQHALAESLLRAVGITVWVEHEALLDAVTALSGSGPAYFFLIMEAMQEAAEQLGLPADDARLLTLQTALGAAKLAMESSEPPAVLRRRVTSKGGTTERAIATLESGELRELFAAALTAAAARATELADELGKN